MNKKQYIIATRASKLAYTQTEQTVKLLRHKHPDIDFPIRTFSTTGDRETKQSLASFDGTGVFVKELENALLDGQADIAVHSLKDVPSFVPDQLLLAAFPQRELVQDVLLSPDAVSLNHLKPGTVIGTDSPRRRVQLAAYREDFKFTGLRGNIDTRIRKMEEGEYDAIVLAAAGLNRYGISFPEKVVIPLDVCLPAIGQGAIALECRKEDWEIRDLLSTVDHDDTHYAVEAERAFMEEMEGGCRFPMAAYAWQSNDQMNLEVMAGDSSMKNLTRLNGQAKNDERIQLGIRLAHQLKQKCEKENINLDV